MDAMEIYVSLDIGGTSIKYGVLDKQGCILEKSNKDTQAWQGGTGIMEKVVRIVEDFREKYVLTGICISTAGMVDVEKGEVFYSAPLIPNYAGTKFKSVLEEHFAIPCEVENDVNCAGLAEYISGAAMGSKSALCLTVGTGIGGCILFDGQVLHGAGYCAGEIGYLHMEHSDFQTLGAASILTEKVAGRKGRPKEEWSGQRIFKEAAEGDAICIRAIDEMTEVLGKGIADICYVIDPEVVVLGGGIMAQEEFLYPRIRDSLDRHLKPVLAEHTRIAFAKHRNDAGMLGAFYHFRQRRDTMRDKR